MAGRLSRWRRKFGIAAPRVAVRTHIPWYWRWIGISLLLGLSAASAAWIYDAGRRIAGFDQSEVRRELEMAREELVAARAELERLRALVNAADSKVSIERTAQQKLAQQVRAMEAENARVREELATLESMLSSDARAGTGITIHRFKVEPDGLPGEYRYRMVLLTPTGRKDKEFAGRLELVVNLNEGGRGAMMTFPEQADAAAPSFRLNFKHFRRVEGTFRVSPRAKVESVQVRVYESGVGAAKATQSVTL